MANGALPAPQLVSTLAPSDVCGRADGFASPPDHAAGDDLANPSRSWLFLRSPGTDGLCMTLDDNFRAVRFDMTAGTAPLTIGEPQVDITTASGGFGGVVVRNGNQMQRLDADLGSATPLFSVDAASYTNFGRAFGSAMPGFWLFLEGGKLWGVNLATPAIRVELTTLLAGEVALVAADGASAFVGLTTATGTRILRIAESLTATPVTVLTSQLVDMAVTPTRLVMMTSSTTLTLSSVAKAGGPTLLLHDFGQGVSQGVLLASGENVYAAFYQIDANGLLGVSTLIIGADGGNPVLLSGTDIKRSIGAAQMPLAPALNGTYAVLLSEGTGLPAFNNAGNTLRAVNGATRGTVMTYGSLPASPEGVLVSGTVDPLQYGQSGLLAFFGIDGDVFLYFFKSNAAGLIRVPF